MRYNGVKVSVVMFPGSNCDYDALYAFRYEYGADARFVWHKEEVLGESDLVVLPGGFSYGDYLRCGAIARFSPIMKEVKRYASDGGFVLGICNGFQILCESGLLPGALMKNRNLRFVCKDAYLQLGEADTPYVTEIERGEILKIPIAHADGNYVVDDAGLAELKKNRQITFRYCDRKGNIGSPCNPNGSTENIAGIINREGNVMGMMPHPERAVDELLMRTDGRKIFNSILSEILKRKGVSS